MLQVQSVGKTFALKRQGKKSNVNTRDPREQGSLFHALRKVDFELPRGCTLGLLGANGAGKTTLMRMLGTSLIPSLGSIRLHGDDVVKHPNKARKHIGFLSGNTGLYNRLSAEELLQFYGRLYGLSKVELKHRIAELTDELNMGNFVHRRIDNLSAGMKQRVSIARSLIHSPDFIIFDEPTTGLDVPTAQMILDYIEDCKYSGKSIIFSTHHMHEVEKLCDLVVLIDKGLVLFNGTVAQMKARAAGGSLDDAYLAITGEKPLFKRYKPAIKPIISKEPVVAYAK